MLLQGAKALQMQYNMKWLHYSLYCMGRIIIIGNFILYLIGFKILRGKYYGKDVVLGNGYQKRDIILVKDFVKYSKSFVNQNNKILNIGAGEKITIREFAKNL